MARFQDGLGQVARTSAVSGHRGYSGQQHGRLQYPAGPRHAPATPDDKAIWKAVVTSDTGWTHTFTLLRLAPALIWEGSERPPAFQGTVEVVQDDTATADASPLHQTLRSSLCRPPARQLLQRSPLLGLGTQAASVDGVDALLDLLGTPDVTLPSTTASPNEPTETGTTHDQEPELLPAAPSAAAVKNETQVHPSGEHFIASAASAYQHPQADYQRR